MMAVLSVWWWCALVASLLIAGAHDQTVQGATGYSGLGLKLTLDPSADLATISMKGPSGVWFGFSFGGLVMGDQPWSVLASGNGGVWEQRLGDHTGGIRLNPSVTVLSNQVVNGVRTLNVTRGLKGRSAEYYSFNASESAVSMLAAYGKTEVYSYHEDRAQISLDLTPA
eukprot:TRINITY_DN13971_c0_g1_i2.p1 TRINITY_DN13971_c0_g1~~TRINITY_DN13971_c0_g1_i2.p1  ORF type:complete len:169 (-),score=39.31 TRINITY_DN13971_c0_g1_i2:343-849(-)